MLSSLKPELDNLGLSLYAVVHENLGVKEFQPFFKGEIFLDVERRFYGPKERRTLIMGLLRIGVWYNLYRAYQKGFSGNLEGDGTLLGGVFVLGPGNTGILYEHKEMEFGDIANMTEVIEAAKRIKPSYQ
ncbi:redox-regulatory protein FAM213A-like [Limulus polyphemus]|uniref:Peroxiredoxin-like 2A n=1 Tax=Limulus polyphemus TaxID=6850 RepID=A0ABM1BY88_LIMPO|nr:redox-regulatory protein FAM213A-like [Limulus polyphemus]XP_013790952.1 redox-regulatory protein FAM213A-like [Limulus polyphemus]